MKPSLIVLSLLATFLISAVAFAAPEVAVDHGTFNFGTIVQGRKVQHDFTIRNTGDGPLQIRQLVASCGCTAAKPSTSLILPGKSAEIQVTFDSANFSGKVQKSVVMMTNAGRTPNYTFNLEGTIVEELQVSPRQLSLGTLAPGVAKQASVTVTNRGASTVKILTVTANSNSLQIRPSVKKTEIKPGESAVVEMSVTSKPDAKIFSGYLHIMTNSAQKKELTVPVYASVAR